MKNSLKSLWLLICLGLAGAVPSASAAIVNISVTVATEDGFKLVDSSESALANGSLVRIGLFYNPSTGAALDNTAIAALYNPLSAFSANLTSLSSSFLEIGTGTIGFTGLNGSDVGYFDPSNGEDGINRPYGTAPAVFAREDDDGNPLPGTFIRAWLDATLPIESLSTAPYNSIANVRLTGALLSVIAYNASTESAATELLVARSVAAGALPSEAGESGSFDLGVSSSTLLIGTSVTGGYATIPEPTTAGLIALSALFFVQRRKSKLGKSIL